MAVSKYDSPHAPGDYGHDHIPRGGVGSDRDPRPRDRDDRPIMDASNIERLHDRDMHIIDRRLSAIERDVMDLCKELHALQEWVEADAERSRWFYEVRKDLQYLVESRRWIEHTRRVIAWIVGAIIGGMMLVGQVWPWVQNHLPRNGS